jgi:hypothetical protein
MVDEPGPHGVLPIDRLPSRPRISTMCRALRRRLRDIEACLRASPDKLYHMGIRGRVSRSTLADANEKHDWHIFADFAQILIQRARGLYADDPFGVELQNSAYALDSTTIDLCLAMFPWARFREQKGAVKVHALIDLHGNIPVFVRITDGKVHDVNILDQLLPEAGAFYVVDRGYVDFQRLYRLTLAAAFFVTRTKENVVLQRRYSHSVPPDTGVKSDQTVVLMTPGSLKHYPAALRKVRYFDADHQRFLVFLTNNFELPALIIANLYKARWQVELFFESSTWCTPLDVMEFRGPIALNRPLVGLLNDSVRPRIAGHPRGTVSRLHPHRPASRLTVSIESTAKQWSA